MFSAFSMSARARAVSSAASKAARSAALEVAHSCVVDQVLAHRALEAEQVAHHGLRVVAEQLDPAGVPGDRPGGQLVAGGVGHHPGVGLVPDPQAVLAEQGGGVGVVRRHGGLEDLLVVRGGAAASVPGRGQAVADAAAELAGRLGREGQAEDLVGGHLAGHHEVHHPCGHQRGLAGSGARDHDRGLERRRDRRPLLRADPEVGAHHPLQVGGVVDAHPGRRRPRGHGVLVEAGGGVGPAHDSTVPAPRTGQIATKSQVSQ